MKKIYLIIITFLFVIIFASFFTLFNESLFIVKNVELLSDFDINKQKLIEYLEIYPFRSIWQYKTKEMEEKLASQIFLKEYQIEKKLPATLQITLKIRKAVVQITSQYDKNILIADKNGVIFRIAESKDADYPLIILDKKSKIMIGQVLNDRYLDTVRLLYEMSIKLPNIYHSIGEIQIESIQDRLVFTIMYKTYNDKFIINDKITIDNLITGIAALISISNGKNRYFYGLNDGYFNYE